MNHLAKPIIITIIVVIFIFLFIHFRKNKETYSDAAYTQLMATDAQDTYLTGDAVNHMNPYVYNYYSSPFDVYTPYPYLPYFNSAYSDYGVYDYPYATSIYSSRLPRRYRY